MYLSNLLINTGDNSDRPRPGRLWLRNLYRVHQRLCMAFPSAAQKSGDPDFLQPYDPAGFQHVHGQRTANQAFLFRIDPFPAGRAMILVQSAIMPGWEYAFNNADYLLAGPPQVRDYTPTFREGQPLRFRLMANATRKIDTKTHPDGMKSNGNRVPVACDKLITWLKAKGEKNGFNLYEDSLTIQTGFAAGYPDDDNPKRFFYARYEGRLQVINVELLLDAVMSGIGPAKGFGFGLLSVAPVNGQL